MGQPAEDIEQLWAVVADRDYLREVVCWVGGTPDLGTHHLEHLPGAVEGGDFQWIEAVVRYDRVQHQPRHPVRVGDCVAFGDEGAIGSPGEGEGGNPQRLAQYLQVGHGG